MQDRGGLHFRAPGRALPLATLLAWALPDAREAVRAALVRERRVHVDGEVSTAFEAEVPPGACVAVSGAIAPGSGGRAEFAPGADPPAAFARALVLAPPWQAGELTGAEGEASLAFRVRERRGELAELELRGAGSDAEALARRLAAAGLAVVGDARHGGVLVAGGPRLARSSDEHPGGAPPDAVAGSDGPDVAAWWPGGPLRLGRPPAEGRSVDAVPFRVSEATLRALSRGHPWVVEDDECDDPARFRPGALVRLRAPGGRDGSLAVVDGEGRVAARVWSRARESRSESAESVASRIARALERRARWLGGTTDALRLVHGEADDLPGLSIDRLGPVLRALVSSRAALGYGAGALEALADALGSRGLAPPGGWVGIEVVHLRRLKAARLACVATRFGDPASLALDERGRLVVRERGLAFAVEPGLAEPTRATPGVGLFLDQRENRARLARHARGGGRWLNLFAHTGAFSVALLAAGAEQVVSVDLSAAYLRWLEYNLALNSEQGVDADRHRSLRGDGRRILSELGAGERFRGILLDPPTAAAAGKRFWSVRKDLEPMIEKALEHLEPSGWLLVCRNDRRGGGRLEASVRAAAARAHVELASISGAPPGPDFPRLKTFPEGDPFTGVLAQRGG